MDEDVPSSVKNCREENSNDSLCEVDRKRVKTDHKLNGEARAKLTNGNKRQPVEINREYVENLPTLIQLYRDELMDDSQNEFVNQNITILQRPFRVAQLKNFCQNEAAVSLLHQLISTTGLQKKKNDLYSLKQSVDLHNLSAFKDFCKFFENDVRKFVENITGLQLNSKVSLTISRYDENDFLLCHDDQLETRKVAFILYFVDPKWSETDGGQLELFQCNNTDRQPTEVVHCLTPCWNMLNFFEVQPLSYHQVGEVTTSAYPRLSINGWFHCNSRLEISRKYHFSLSTKIRESLKVSDNVVPYDMLMSWLNPSYFVDFTQQKIKSTFVKKSEIQLATFLREQKCAELEEGLKSIEESSWKQYFYPVLAKYEYIPEQLLLSDEQSTVVPKIVQEFYKVISSEAFCLILSNLTGLRLHPMALLQDSDDVEWLESDSSKSGTSSNKSNKKSSLCRLRGEIRRWKHGHYTLANDLNPEAKEKKALDVMLFLNLPKESDNDSIYSVHSSDNEDMDTNEPDVEVPANPPNSASMTPSTSGNLAPVPPKKDIKEIVISSDSEDDEEEKGENIVPVVEKILKKPEPEVIDLDEEEDEEDLDEADLEDDMSDHDDVDEVIRNSGGYVTYVHPNIDHELLSIEPAYNSLNMVYRLKGTQRVMNYIKRNNRTVPFYQISFVYYEL